MKRTLLMLVMAITVGERDLSRTYTPSLMVSAGAAVRRWNRMP